MVIAWNGFARGFCNYQTNFNVENTKKTQFVEWSRCLKLELRGRVKMIIAWNGFAIESLQLQTWGVKYCKWLLEPACLSKQCNTFYTAYTAPDLMLTNGVTPCKEFFHQSDALTGTSKNIMRCGGGLSWVLMGECDHFFIGNLLLLLRESPLVVDEQSKSQNPEELQLSLERKLK